MSILGTYKYSGVGYNAGVSDGIQNVIGYMPSGATGGVILGVGLFLWSGSYADGYWMPARREWFNAP
jgi:hypothetical protein